MNDDKLDLLVELVKTSKDETNRRIDDVNRRIDDSKESNLLLHNNHKEVTEANFQSLRDCINTNQRVVGTAITIFGILLAIVGIMLAVLMFMMQQHAHPQESRDDEMRQDKVTVTLNRWECDPNIYLVSDTTVEETRKLALDDCEGKIRKEY